MAWLVKIWFLDVDVTDFLDITLVAFIAYRLYLAIRRSVMPQALLGLLSLVVLWQLVELFEMTMTQTLLREFVQLGALVLVVVFAPEIRRLLLNFAPNTFFERIRRSLAENLTSERNLQEITDGLLRLRKNRYGALVVLAGRDNLAAIEQTGIAINADISPGLLVAIFSKASPLHDGAAVVTDNQITYAKCLLPLDHNPDLPDAYGTRHHAAVSLSNQTDAAILVLSEETGMLSAAYRGHLRDHLSPEQLTKFMVDFYNGRL